jgi:hypothetical protein
MPDPDCPGLPDQAEEITAAREEGRRQGMEEIAVKLEWTMRELRQKMPFPADEFILGAMVQIVDEIRALERTP